MNRTEKYHILMERFPGLMVDDEPLIRHTTIRIGGTADLFCEVDEPMVLLEVLRTAHHLGVPCVLIGGGSNLLVDDRGFRGLIVKFFSSAPPNVAIPVVTVSGGLPLKDMLKFVIENSLGGLEFLSGIPGSVGGAVYMNAGAFGKNVSDIIVSADLITGDYILKTVQPEFFCFDYRSSILQSCPGIVVSATFKVYKRDMEEIRKECNEILALRASKHPDASIPCAGSYFKNLPPEKPGDHRRPAGYFLDQAGAKAMRVGGATVFSRHANIITNAGSATALDVLNLSYRMKNAVFQQSGITLEEEVRFLDAEKGIITGSKKMEDIEESWNKSTLMQGEKQEKS